MCGIMGYCGSKQAASVVLEGLRNLEYRGYDSAGIAALADGRLRVKKDVGKIEEVNAKQRLASLPGHMAIGHTRWATHGGVTRGNAHPHSDCKKRIAVVHNGIVENHEQLRQELVGRGHSFSSQTDTEVIPHLIGDEFKNGSCSLKDAVLAIAPRLQGSYAFAALSLDDPGVIVGTRKNNPLMVGLGDGEYYLSSDALALSQHASEVVVLGDAEVVVLSSARAEFFDASGYAISKEAKQIDRIWADSRRDGYPHFMLKEITEQPWILKRVLQQDEKKFNAMALDLLRSHQVIITACGTSRYAALVGRYLFSKVARKFSDVVIASEFGYFADSVDKNTMVIAVSQSGETADVIEGVRAARAAGGQVLSIVNRPSSMLESLSDHTILLNCGAEIGVAATKSFLAQLAAFYLLSFSMVNSFDEGCSHISSVSGKVKEALSNNNHRLIALTERLKGKTSLYYIGRGINFAVASEAALKLKELSYMHAEGMPAGELKHGTLALIEKGTPVVAICPGDLTYDETMNNVMEARARGAYIIGVSDRKSNFYDFWVRIPQVDELLYPMVSIIPLQLLAYDLAVARGCDPDKPRNLAKSVTVK